MIGEALCEAVIKKDAAAVARWLTHTDVDLTYKNEMGDTPLNLAARNGTDEIIRLLVNAGVDVNSKNTFGQTPLHDVIRFSESLEMVSFLISRGANVNAKDWKGVTPLHHSAMHPSKIKIFEFLLQHDANIHEEDVEGGTPLSYAVCGGNLETASILTDLGADASKITHTFSQNVYSKFHERTDLLELLLENGMPPNEVWKKCLDFSVSQRRSLFNPKVLQLLIKYGGDINKIFVAKGVTFLEFEHLEENCVISILEHLAILQVLKLPVDPGLVGIISRKNKYDDYYARCIQELQEAKKTKLRNCWVTFFNLLTDNESKLIKYAGNKDLIEDFKNTDLMEMFPLYGEELQNKVSEALRNRKIWNYACVILSNQLPIFNFNHLIIRNIADCLVVNDLRKLYF